MMSNNKAPWYQSKSRWSNEADHCSVRFHFTPATDSPEPGTQGLTTGSVCVCECVLQFCCNISHSLDMTPSCLVFPPGRTCLLLLLATLRSLKDSHLFITLFIKHPPPPITDTSLLTFYCFMFSVSPASLNSTGCSLAPKNVLKVLYRTGLLIDYEHSALSCYDGPFF